MYTTLDRPDRWAQMEFALAEVGDARLSRRLVQVASAIAQCPSGTLPQALPQWSELKAAYRLFSNPKVRGRDRTALAAHAPKLWRAMWIIPSRGSSGGAS